MNKDSILNMPFDRTGQNNPFDGASNTFQFIHIIAMGDPLHILLNNRTSVKLFGHIVGSSADDLHPALIGPA